MTPPELAQSLPSGIPEKRQGLVRNWGEMCLYLDKFLPKIDPHHIKFVRGYFSAQVYLAEEKKTKAEELFRGLEEKADYAKFEKDNWSLLRTIDIAVRGESNQQEF